VGCARSRISKRSWPRFCGEFGQQSPASWTALEKRPIGAEEMYPGSRAVEHRQACHGRDASAISMSRSVVTLTFASGTPRLNTGKQRALKTGIEWLRIQRPRCMGALVWQFNDAWTALSWSLVDADGEEKSLLSPLSGTPLHRASSPYSRWRDDYSYSASMTPTSRGKEPLTLRRHNANGPRTDRSDPGYHCSSPAAGVATLLDVEGSLGGMHLLSDVV